jgi:4-aminobutyrate aminotransferase / (S)-3-amino-2-methylpropionate transaminase
MRNLGVLIGSCGVQTIRLRPMLIFIESNIDPLIGAFKVALARM